METKQPDTRPYDNWDKFPIESLREMLQEAASTGDIAAIEMIRREAHARDGYDDTYPFYAHLIDDCNDVLNRLGSA